MEPEAAMMEADLGEMIAGMPHVMTWGDQNITVSLDDMARSDEAHGIAGMFENRDVGVSAAVSSFRDRITPPINVIVTMGGETFRLMTSMDGPDGIGWRANLRRKSA